MRVLLVVMLVACSAPAKKEEPLVKNHADKTEDFDGDLVARIRRSMHVSPAHIEDAVGLKAIINVDGPDLAILDRTDLVPDPQHGDEVLARHRAKAIIYWRRPVPDDEHGNPHVVGVQILDDGSVRLFYALVLPP